VPCEIDIALAYPRFRTEAGESERRGFVSGCGGRAKLCGRTCHWQERDKRSLGPGVPTKIPPPGRFTAESRLGRAPLQ